MLSAALARGRRALRAGLAVIAAGVFVFLSTGSALAEPPPPIPAPTNEAAQPAPGPVTDQPSAAVNGLIDPALLASLQPSIVGLVTIWEEPADRYARHRAEPAESTPFSHLPVFSICTGWFATPTTIVTAGHCVDPELGRQAMHEQNGPRDENGSLLPPDPTLPTPERTVWAFQPRELDGAVLTSPVIVHVDEFRNGDEGDTAKLHVYGQPPAKPMPIAANAPQVGETVTSIGFPGLNIVETDGVDLTALLTASKSPAEVLQESRLQAVNTSGTIGSRQYRDGVAVYQVNADLSFGMSGGPTINSRGEVLGVNSKATFFGQNFNVITDTGMLREFLGHHQPQQASATPDAAAETTAAAGPAAEPAAAPVTAPPAAAASTGWFVDGTSLFGGAILGALAIGGLIGIRRGSGAGRSTAAPTDQQPGSATALP
jgi:hypothetical protein